MVTSDMYMSKLTRDNQIVNTLPLQKWMQVSVKEGTEPGFNQLVFSFFDFKAIY